MRLKSNARIAISLVAASGMLAGFGGLSMGATTAHVRPVLTSQDKTAFFIIDDGIGFDPALWSWDAHEDQIGIFEGLVHFGPGDKPAPGIATSWSNNGKNDNGLVWTFHLRHNARFSNGDPVTAQDFVYSIERAVNPATAAATHHGSSWFGDVPLKNAPAIVAGTASASTLGVSAPNAYTVQFNLSAADPTLLQQLCLDPWQLPVDQRIVEKMPETDWTNPQDIVSDGPYMLQTYKTGISATLVPNPYYYQKVPLKQINLIYTTSTDGLLAFKNGAEQIALLSATDVPAAESDPAIKKDLHWESAAIQYTFRVSPSKNPLLQDNQKVREAFEMAIDRQVITKRVMLNTGTPAYYSHIPSTIAPWVTKAGYYYNPKEAQKLLAQAGYPGGKGFPTVVLLDSGTTDPTAEAVQQMWETTLHVKVKLEMDEWGTFLTDLYKQLPANEVGFYQWGDNGTYPMLALPTSMSNIASTTWSWMPIDALPPAAYAKYYAINNDQSLKSTVRLAEENKLILSSIPKSDVNILELGVKADQTHNPTLMEKYIIDVGRLAYNLPVYTVRNGVLVDSHLKGYSPVIWWDTDSPVWMGYLHYQG